VPYGESNVLGVVYYDNTNWAAGQICAVATVTPAGIHKLIPYGWDWTQMKGTETFVDNMLYPAWSFPPWTSDGPDSVNANKTIVLDDNDKLYTIDGPNIDNDPSFGATNSIAEYKNFYDYVTWFTETCSSTNN